MTLTRIIQWAGKTLVICCGVLLVNAVFGLILLEFQQASIFALLAGIVGIAGLLVTLTTLNIKSRPTNGDTLIFFLLFWALIPVIGALPFLLSLPELSMTHAYFEAVSAITTTGASTLDPDSLPRTLLLWRSLLQWVGGVTIAIFAVIVLAALNLSGTGVHRSMLFTLKDGDLFARILSIGRVIIAVYGSIALLCWISLMISGTPVFDALCLSLSGVSTGGFAPRSGLLAEYVNPFGVTILAISCALGAMNIAVLWDFFRLRSWRTLHTALRNAEHRGLLVIVLILIFIGLFYTGTAHLWTLIIEAIFFASSTGFDYHVIGIEMISPTVLIAIALIGGSALSTAGGIKIIRILLLFRHLSTDLKRLTHPSRVVPVKFRDMILPDTAFLSIWMYFFGYTVVFSLAILALSAAELPYDIAVSSAASALANMGPLLDYTLPELSYADFNPSQLSILSTVMILGRIEVLAALAVLSPAFWRQ